MSNTLSKDLERAVQDAEPCLLTLSDTDAGRRKVAGKWSPKEMIGHLIDSASNNHGRFVQAQFSADLVFDGYGQDDWVATQRYQDADWEDLVGLWKAFNLHLAHVVAAIPVDVLQRQRPKHNLHRIAWGAVAESESTTLAYFVGDYIGHLRHHLAQILDA